MIHNSFQLGVVVSLSNSPTRRKNALSVTSSSVFAGSVFSFHFFSISFPHFMKSLMFILNKRHLLISEKDNPGNPMKSDLAKPTYLYLPTPTNSTYSQIESSPEWVLLTLATFSLRIRIALGLEDLCRLRGRMLPESFPFHILGDSVLTKSIECVLDADSWPLWKGFSSCTPWGLSKWRLQGLWVGKTLWCK